MDKLKRLQICYPEEYLASVLQILGQSRRCIRIWSHDLEPAVYDNPSVRHALSAMVRDNRRAEARLLLADASSLLKSGHCLVGLMRQLPSAVKIRECTSLPDRYLEDYIVGDLGSVAARIPGDEDLAFVDFNAAAETADRARHFDYLWQRGRENAELRALSL